jgi:hypothetical protein
LHAIVNDATNAPNASFAVTPAGASAVMCTKNFPFGQTATALDRQMMVAAVGLPAAPGGTVMIETGSELPFNTDPSVIKQALLYPRTVPADGSGTAALSGKHCMDVITFVALITFPPTETPTH